MSALKRKRYYFNEEWELTYFCAMVNDTCTCLICNASLALPKKGNVERHFMTRHAKYKENFPLGSEAREMKVNALKSNLRGLQRNLKKFCTSSKTATAASFKASFFLPKKGKAFSEGELLKECFLKYLIAFYRISATKTKSKGLLKSCKCQEIL